MNLDSHSGRTLAAASSSTGTQALAKDPICGMMVGKATALTSERGGRTYYFCSHNCLRTFEDPERELKSMRLRVTVALTGVLALAVLRAGAFLALAAGATIVTWAPIPALPWFTWGVWLFILVTPVQFIGGWSFYVGAWQAIRSRAINMDFLIALGTTVAYLYSVAVVFAPDILPVKVEERDIYFEVSAVIIAFVLLGKYMEEIIKKRSSAAVSTGGMPASSCSIMMLARWRSTSQNSTDRCQTSIPYSQSSPGWKDEASALVGLAEATASGVFGCPASAIGGGVFLGARVSVLNSFGRLVVRDM